MSVEVSGADESGHGVDVARWVAVIETTLQGEGVASGQLDLTFVDEERMADLNQEHMGSSGPTDVLAFPLDDGLGTEFSFDTDSPVLPRLLGDVVICPTVALRQAAEHTGSTEAELTLLAVHGTLHVLGHDHAEPQETIAMQDRERHYLAHFGFSHPVPAPS